MKTSGFTVRHKVLAWLAVFAMLASLPAATAATQTQKGNAYDSFRNRDRGKGAMSRDNELKFAEAAHQEIAKDNKFITDPTVLNYVNDLGKRLARDSERSDLPYQFYVIDNNQINAFTPGGGRIYVYTGLIKSTTSEGQLASVLAHEIGHNAGYHVSEQIKQAQRIGIMAAIAGALLGNSAAGNVSQLAIQLVGGGLLFKRSREAEREADYLGLHNIDRTGYNTDEMNNMFRMLASLGKKPGALDKIFASHPPASERLENTQREIDEHLRGSDREGKRTTTAYEDVRKRLGSGNLSTSEGAPRSTNDTTADRRDAERVLERIGERGARVVEAARGDVTGRNESGLVVVYQQRNEFRAVVDLSGRTYDLYNVERERRLAMQSFYRLRIRPGLSTGERPQIVIVSTDSRRQRVRDYWEWTGRDFRFVGTDSPDR